MSQAELIALPNDPLLVAQLNRKLQRYQGRLRFLPPQSEILWDTKFKIEILRQVLSKTQVRYSEVLESIRREAANFSLGDFNQAWAVIEAYTSGGLDTLEGGTGL